MKIRCVFQLNLAEISVLRDSLIEYALKDSERHTEPYKRLLKQIDGIYQKFLDRGI